MAIAGFSSRQAEDLRLLRHHLLCLLTQRMLGLEYLHDSLQGLGCGRL